MQGFKQTPVLFSGGLGWGGGEFRMNVKQFWLEDWTSILIFLFCSTSCAVVRMQLSNYPVSIQTFRRIRLFSLRLTVAGRYSSEITTSFCSRRSLKCFTSSLHDKVCDLGKYFGSIISLPVTNGVLQRKLLNQVSKLWLLNSSMWRTHHLHNVGFPPHLQLLNRSKVRYLKSPTMTSLYKLLLLLL